MEKNPPSFEEKHPVLAVVCVFGVAALIGLGIVAFFQIIVLLGAGFFVFPWPYWVVGPVITMLGMLMLLFADDAAEYVLKFFKRVLYLWRFQRPR